MRKTAHKTWLSTLSDSQAKEYGIRSLIVLGKCNTH